MADTTDKTTETTTPAAETTEAPEEIVSVPAGAKRLSGTINDDLANRLFLAASDAVANPRGISNGKVYPSREDETFKKDSARWRKHLAARLNADTQRAALAAYPSGDGVSFMLRIATRTKREKKTEKTTASK